MASVAEFGLEAEFLIFEDLLFNPRATEIFYSAERREAPKCTTAFLRALARTSCFYRSTCKYGLDARLTAKRESEASSPNGDELPIFGAPGAVNNS